MKTNSVITMLSALLISGCATKNAADKVAKAQLLSSNDQKISGLITFKQSASELRIEGRVSGLKPNSKHGFHIHEKGDCSAPDFSSAGGHFNPHNQSHGSIESSVRHLGDLGNLTSDAAGIATVDKTVKTSDSELKDGALTQIVGKSLIVHQNEDDLKTQPTGNAGPRWACAVISY